MAGSDAPAVQPDPEGCPHSTGGSNESSHLHDQVLQVATLSLELAGLTRVAADRRMRVLLEAR